MARIVKGWRLHRNAGRKKRYQARIVVDGKRVSLGYFGSQEEASAAFIGARTALGALRRAI